MNPPTYDEVIGGIDPEFATVCSEFERSGALRDPHRANRYTKILDGYFTGTLDPYEAGALTLTQAVEMIRAL